MCIFVALSLSPPRRCQQAKKWRLSFRVDDFGLAMEKSRVCTGQWLDYHGIRVEPWSGVVSVVPYHDVNKRTTKGGVREEKPPADINCLTCKACNQRGALLACDLCPTSYCDPRFGRQPAAGMDRVHEPLIESPEARWGQQTLRYWPF